MKVAFFGTSDRSLPILESLKSNFDLALCVTKKDTLVGRHQEVKEGGVKTWAKNNRVDFVEVDSLKNDNLALILDTLKKKNIEYGVVADFSFIIPYGLLEYFKDKLINIHFSLLPKYRGASPVQFFVLSGENTTGITFHLVDIGMDTGAVIKQYEYKVNNNNTSGELYDLLFKFAGEKLPEVLNGYAGGDLKPTLQDNTKATYTYSPSHPKSTFIYKEDAYIKWDKDVQIIEREIRAYNPWPISWCYLKDLPEVEFKKTIDTNLKVKIYSAEIIDNKLGIKQLQVEGKRMTDYETFKNGYLETTAA